MRMRANCLLLVPAQHFAVGRRGRWRTRAHPAGLLDQTDGPRRCPAQLEFMNELALIACMRVCAFLWFGFANQCGRCLTGLICAEQSADSDCHCQRHRRRYKGICLYVCASTMI